MYLRGVSEVRANVERSNEEGQALPHTRGRDNRNGRTRRKSSLVDSVSTLRAFWREQRDLVDCAKTVLIPVAWYVDIIALLVGVSYGGCRYGPIGALAGFFLSQSVVLYKISGEIRRRMAIWLSESWEGELVSARKVEEFKRELAKTKRI